MEWNPWVDSIRQASRRPSAVSAKPIKPITNTEARAASSVSGTPASGVAMSRRTPCKSASVAPPRTCPSTMAERGTGAASTPCRKRAFLSSTTAKVEKMAVKSTTMAIMPG